MGNSQKSYKNECNEVIALIDQFNNKFKKKIKLIDNDFIGKSKSNKKNTPKYIHFMDKFNKSEKNYFKHIVPKIISDLTNFSYKSESNWRNHSQIKGKRKLDLECLKTIEDFNQEENCVNVLNTSKNKHKNRSLEVINEKHDLKHIFEKIKTKKTNKKHSSKIKNAFNTISDLLTKNKNIEYYQYLLEKDIKKAKSLEKIQKICNEYHQIKA